MLSVAVRSAGVGVQGQRDAHDRPGARLVAAVVAAITDPSSAGDLLLAAIAVGAFVAWAVAPRVPLWALSAAVIIPVAVAQHDGGLEPVLTAPSCWGRC
jgi:hypothetical protein